MANWKDREGQILSNMERKWDRNSKNEEDNNDALTNPKHPKYNSLENQIKREELNKIQKGKDDELRRIKKEEKESETRYTGIPDRETYVKNLDSIAAKEAARGKK